MNVHTCKACGWTTKAPAHVMVIFHPCQNTGRRQRLTFDPPDREEERQAWAREKLGGQIVNSLEEALGDRAFLPADDTP